MISREMPFDVCPWSRIYASISCVPFHAARERALVFEIDVPGFPVLQASHVTVLLPPRRERIVLRVIDSDDYDDGRQRRLQEHLSIPRPLSGISLNSEV